MVMHDIDDQVATVLQEMVGVRLHALKRRRPDEEANR